VGASAHSALLRRRAVRPARRPAADSSRRWFQPAAACPARRHAGGRQRLPDAGGRRVPSAAGRRPAARSRDGAQRDRAHHRSPHRHGARRRRGGAARPAGSGPRRRRRLPRGAAAGLERPGPGGVPAREGGSAAANPGPRAPDAGRAAAAPFGRPARRERAARAQLAAPTRRPRAQLDGRSDRTDRGGLARRHPDGQPARHLPGHLAFSPRTARRRLCDHRCGHSDDRLGGQPGRRGRGCGRARHRHGDLHQSRDAVARAPHSPRQARPLPSAARLSPSRRDTRRDQRPRAASQPRRTDGVDRRGQRRVCAGRCRRPRHPVAAGAALPYVGRAEGQPE